MIDSLPEKLRAVPEFSSLPEKQIQWLAEKGTIRTFLDGDSVFTKGDEAQGFQVVFQGQVELLIVQNGNQRSLGAYEPGEILGKLPYSRMKKITGEGRAIGDTILFFLHQEHFPEMITTCYELTEVLVHNMTDRARDFVKFQQQNDKMLALGKLSAGLAHELNNPSAAVVRSAQALKTHLSSIPENFKRVMQIRATEEIVDKVNALVFSKIGNIHNAPLSLMQKTALEDDLIAWLEENEIENAYEMAETFADFSLSTDDLENIRSWVRPEDKAAVINWMTQVLSTEKLVAEIEEASKRINALVTSVKGYTHMDQAPEKQETDIHTGLRNTLTMLNHKLKKNNIKLLENFQEDLPKARIFVSEMNQVWTNLIDNAIDAMEGRPDNTLEIYTRKERDSIVVSVIDNGPGIPDEIRGKIFDPFFTTKAIGKGTGIGLEVVSRIIAEHNGTIDVTSIPGKTEFKVCFPVK